MDSSIRYIGTERHVSVNHCADNEEMILDSRRLIIRKVFHFNCSSSLACSKKKSLMIIFYKYRNDRFCIYIELRTQKTNEIKIIFTTLTDFQIKLSFSLSIFFSSRVFTILVINYTYVYGIESIFTFLCGGHTLEFVLSLSLASTFDRHYHEYEMGALNLVCLLPGESINFLTAHWPYAREPRWIWKTRRSLQAEG